MKHCRLAHWFLWPGLLGMLAAVVLVVAFRESQSATIYRFFTSIDRLSFLAASAATTLVFPRDTVQRGISIAMFFDIVLVVVTGVQCGLLGLLLGLFIGRKSRVPRP